MDAFLVPRPTNTDVDADSDEDSDTDSARDELFNATERANDSEDNCQEAFPAAMTSADAATTITDATAKKQNSDGYPDVNSAPDDQCDATEHAHGDPSGATTEPLTKKRRRDPPS
jgi:hypothetical protein